jgi:ATP-dependent helicase/nuclease subunit A
MSRLRNIAEVAPGEFDHKAISLQRRLLTLYEAAAEIYREKKRDAGLLDFEDLQIYALEMLQNPQNARVREDLRRRYKYVMVDEFQDTNELQWEIISLLGMEDGKLDSGKFFVVGDPKQSIYGFRGADVRVFERVKQQFAENSGESDPHSYSGNVLLKESFRFLPEINTFTNVLFEKILIRDNNEYSVAYEALTTKRQPKADDIPHLELAYFSREYLDSHNLSEANYVARRISELLQTGVIPGDIAVLLAARTNLSELENAMRKLNVPFRTIKGIGFYTRQEIFDVYHLLRFLENPRDDLALAAILRSPLVNISDAGMYLLSRTRGDSWFEKLANIDNLADYPTADRRPLEIFQEQARRWQSRRDRLSLSRLLTEIFEESFYQATIAAHWNGDQILANLDKIISTIREVEQRGFVSLSDYSRALKDTLTMAPREGEAQLELEDRTSVKIMTIHSAKGLEFPIVFLPYLNKGKTGNRSSFRINPEIGIATKITDESAEAAKSVNVKPYLYTLIDELDQNKNLAEYKRLFYVGVTRAKNQLYLSASEHRKSPSSSTETPFNWLIEHLDLAKDFQAMDEEPEANPMRFRAVEIAPDCTLLLTTRIPDVSTGNDEAGDSQNALAQIETTFRELLQEGEAETEERLPTHLRKVDDTPKAVTFSATQLVTFSDNPANYFLRYHQGFFESDYDFLTRFSDDISLGMLKGKIVHKILENGITEDRGELLARLDDVMFQYEIFDAEQQRDLINEIPDMLLRFAATALAKEVFTAPAFHNELSITMSLGDDFFTGTVDRIYKTAGGNWEVIDYKTNHITAEAVEQVGKKYEMQIKGYALLMSRAFPGQTHYTVRLYFLNPGKAYEVRFTPAQIEAIYDEFLSIVGEIKRYKPFGSLIPEVSAKKL